MNALLAISVVPSFWYRVPPVILVIWKNAAAVPSLGLGISTRPLVVCVFSFVTALVTLGVVAAAVTVTLAGTTDPPRPAAVADSDACTLKPKLVPGLYSPVAGLNLRPACPWAAVMNWPLESAVTPLFRYNVPPLMLLIWKYAAAVPSLALGVSTRPLVVCVFSLVVALLTAGVVTAAFTVMLAGTRTRPVPRPSPSRRTAR